MTDDTYFCKSHKRKRSALQTYVASNGLTLDCNTRVFPPRLAPIHFPLRNPFAYGWGRFILSWSWGGFGVAVNMGWFWANCFPCFTSATVKVDW